METLNNLLWKNTTVTHEQTLSSYVGLPILQFLQIKKFVLLDKAGKINNVVYDLLQTVF